MISLFIGEGWSEIDALVLRSKFIVVFLEIQRLLLLLLPNHKNGREKSFGLLFAPVLLLFLLQLRICSSRNSSGRNKMSRQGRQRAHRSHVPAKNHTLQRTQKKTIAKHQLCTDKQLPKMIRV